MTREQYTKAAEVFVGKEFIDRVTFPMLLKSVAEALFVAKDMNSDIANETRRRLKQLDELGYTDE